LREQQQVWVGMMRPRAQSNRKVEAHDGSRTASLLDEEVPVVVEKGPGRSDTKVKALGSSCDSAGSSSLLLEMLPPPLIGEILDALGPSCPWDDHIPPGILTREASIPEEFRRCGKVRWWGPDVPPKLVELEPERRWLWKRRIWAAPGTVCRAFAEAPRLEPKNHLPCPDYMEKKQAGMINARMRGVLVDWLVDVHLKYRQKLKDGTLYQAISLVDRFLEKRQVHRRKLQLVGVCGMLIASKYTEISPPDVQDFVHITDKAYTEEEILAMEITMLNTLEIHHLSLPSPVAILERFAKVNGCGELHLCLARYAMELTLIDIKMLRYSPSHLAASAIFLSNKFLRRYEGRRQLPAAWPAQLVKDTRYTREDVKSCAKEMCFLLDVAVQGASLRGRHYSHATELPGLFAVEKKYAMGRFMSISKMVGLWALGSRQTTTRVFT